LKFRNLLGVQFENLGVEEEKALLVKSKDVSSF